MIAAKAADGELAVGAVVTQTAICAMTGLTRRQAAQAVSVLINQKVLARAAQRLVVADPEE